MTNSKIGRIWLINCANWLIKALSIHEVVKKALKKDKNDILHIYLEYINKTHNKKIVSIVDDIDNDPTKIYFFKLCVNTKIMQNLNTKLMSEVTTKLGRVYMDL